MNDGLLLSIKNKVLEQSPQLSYDKAPKDLVEKAELRLGFPIPPILFECYTKIANGGFGPGYGLIGLEGGATSDYGTIVETYHQLKSDQESEGNEWKAGLLPFCGWGCNIFSCVDCNHEDFYVWQFEDFMVSPLNFNIEQFFHMWISDVDILSIEDYDLIVHEMINPFTGKKDFVTRKVRKKKEE
ncbi:MAG: SMI1/KNR4 family protein [Pirellulales bacterium]|nr:SMI1/KNR4 family protein [Pirellulales bacterium]